MRSHSGLWSHKAYTARMPLRIALAACGCLGFQGSIKWSVFFWCTLVAGLLLTSRAGSFHSKQVGAPTPSASSLDRLRFRSVRLLLRPSAPIKCNELSTFENPQLRRSKRPALEPPRLDLLQTKIRQAAPDRQVRPGGGPGRPLSAQVLHFKLFVLGFGLAHPCWGMLGRRAGGLHLGRCCG